MRRKGKNEVHEFDHVVVAVPNYWVSQIEFEGRAAREAIQKHQARYDNAAHYLRVTVLFKKPFWNEHFQGSYIMSDAFWRLLHL